MKHIYILAAFFFLGLLSLHAQKTDKKLQQKIEKTIKGFHGNIGVYIKDIKTGRTVSINADTVFPTASVVKIPILIGMMQKIEEGAFNYTQKLTYKDSLFYPGVDVLASFKNDEQIELNYVIMLMNTTSDNTASLWLQSLAGGGKRINELMDKLGLKDTRVNSRTEGRLHIREIYGWGQTTPKEIARLMELIYKRQVVSPAASDRMMRIMSRNFWDENAISQIPPPIQIFSKSGAVDETRNEVLLVNAPGRPYIFSVFTKNNKDKSWQHNNEAWVLTRKLSALVWEHFKPKNKLISLQ